MNKIGIKGIGSYVPESFDCYDFKSNKFNLNDNFLNSKIGTHRLSRKLPNEETSDMCVKAYEGLLNKIELPKNIDCLIVVTQNPDRNGIPHTSSIIHRKLKLNDNCAVFDISLGCSGYVYGLSIIESFMTNNRLSNGLLFTCDPYSKIINKNDKNTSLLFGDAATVTFLSRENPRLTCQEMVFASRGIEGASLNNDNGTLEMNGKAVFNFSATEVPKQIFNLLQNNSLTIDDIDLFIFHQGSKFILDTLARKLGIDKPKVATNLFEQGNTVSSSIPLILEKHLQNNNHKKIIISGFGVGLSWASAILNRNI